MKILVISDTHKNISSLFQAIEENPSIEYIFHLGDHDTDIEEIKRKYPDKKYFSVCGNNDFDCVSPTASVQRLGGRTIYYTHGHLFGVHASLDKLALEAKKHSADIALFGHTHIPCAKFVNGVFVFNPGSASRPLGGSEKSYGIIELGEEMLFVHKTL